jgi:hypothetical protein
MDLIKGYQFPRVHGENTRNTRISAQIESAPLHHVRSLANKSTPIVYMQLITPNC